MILFALVLIAIKPTYGQVNPDIVYKYSDAYELIWNDGGSGAKMDGALWRVKNYQSSYCSLGDVATGNHYHPTGKSVLVSQNKPGALINPISFSLVWKDSGSGARNDVAIYQMHAPSMYTCLGGVAVGSYSTQPDVSKYCCVKNEYIVQADTEHTWDDRGSGAHSDVSLWTVIRTGGDADGIFAGNFIGVSGYTKPDSSIAYLLKHDSNKVRDIWSLSGTQDIKPLSLFETNNLKLIWNDKGSGARRDCSIWRSESKEGYFPVGDIVVATWSKPKIGFLIKPTSSQYYSAVSAPVSYSRIWNDKGSGADRDVQLWKVNCPGGYVSLGGVATDGSYPKLGDVYCINNRYVVYGSIHNWVHVWRDHGSGAHADVSIYEAQSKSSSQQSVRGFGAVSSYSRSPMPPFLLATNSHTYWSEKPIEKIYIYSVNFDTLGEKQQTAPVKMNPTVVTNLSDQTQVVTRTINYSISKSSSFTFSVSIQVGIEAEIEASVPIIGAGITTTFSASTTSTFTTGETKTTTHVDSIAAEVTLPKRSKVVATIYGTEYKSDIPYTAKIRKVYYDGTETLANMAGIYKGVTVLEINVHYGETEYLD